MAHVGFIGLGKMGGRDARRLLDAGHIVAATSTVFRLVGPLLWWMDDLADRLSRVPALL